MSLFLLSVKAAGFGLAVAAPVGPMSLLCMRRTMTLGWRQGLATGELASRDAIEMLLEATALAMGTVERPVIAHPFSLLPKIGLDESAVTDAMISHFALAAMKTGALVEINEKWSCPGPRLAGAMLSAGVHLVAGSDAHQCDAVGHYEGVAQTIAIIEDGAPALAGTH